MIVDRCETEGPMYVVPPPHASLVSFAARRGDREYRIATPP